MSENLQKLPTDPKSGSQLTRKPSIKKRPEVRQTLASKLRLLKANPLLAHEISQKLGPTEDRKPLAALAKALNGNLQCDNNLKAVQKAPIGAIPKMQIPSKPAKKDIQAKLVKTKCHVGEHNPKLRRSSVSTGDIKKRVTFNETLTTPGKPFRGQLRSTPGPSFLLNMSPVRDEGLTPEDARKSFKTPQSNNISRRSTMVLKPLPTSGLLRRRLTDWLKRRGKEETTFRHLKCFGLHKDELAKLTLADEDKENIPSVDSSSYEDLGIAGAIIPEIVNDGSVAKEALFDLHTLILEGYSPDQCDAWLQLIYQRSHSLEENPEYWECRAALEQAYGNLPNAVNYYKKAIIQGAEIQQIDKSLDQLLKKFSLLNITVDTQDKKEAKVIKDARNIFKSSIIQFAVQERTLRKGKTEEQINKQKTVTPVRRSTRMSRGIYASTPGVQMVASLQELTSPDRRMCSFKANNALLP